MGSALSKFNPYHDERGRFTSANAAATMSGGALGANRELTISIMERALGRSLTGPERTTIRETDLRQLYVVATRSDPDLVAQRLDPHPKLGQAMNLVVRQEVRADTKERGAKTIADEMTPDERAACEAALLHGWPDRDLTVEHLVGQQHNLWASTAGDHQPEALAVQVSAAEMQGWDNQKIADRVFRETSREDVAVARELAKRVIEDGPVTEVILGDWGWLERSKAIEAAAVAMAHPDVVYLPAVQVAAQTFIHSELMGDAHKAVLAANQRVAQRELKAAVGDSPTITLFRGVQVSVDPAVTWGGVPVEEFTYPDIAREGAREERGQTVRSQSSPLSSWSVSYNESSKFSGDHGVVLQAEVPVSSLVGLSSVGFGCLSEGEVIVSGASFTATVMPTHQEAFPTGEPFPVEKAIPTINLDATDANQDWPKRTPDTYAALGLKSPVSKFNPHHDELGRFTTAGGAAGGGATSYTGGRGRHEGTIEVTDYNGEPRLLMPITSYVEEGTELPDGRITEGGYHIDEQEARGLASEIFDVELELKDADGKPIKVRASLLSPYHSRVGATVKDDNTQYARIKFAGSLMLKEEGVEEYPVGEFNGEIDPFGESAYIAGDVFGAPSGPGGETVKDGKPLASIDGLYINVRDLQGLGVGTALMAHWEDQLARTGVDRIVIEAVSNSGGLTGGYSWMKYGYTPARGAVDSVLRQFVDEKVESDWELPSSKSIGNLAAMLGLPSHTANPEYHSPLQRLERIQSHMPWGKQWEAITESGTTNENFGSYEWRHGQDWTPVLEAVPEFKDFALAEARWYGSKKLETIEKAATPALSPQIEATIRVANRWMRENPAGLENDDDAFWAEVAEARASAPVSKFNPYHDELGRFTSANAAATISGGALGANRKLTISLVDTVLMERGLDITSAQKTEIRNTPAGSLAFNAGFVTSADVIDTDTLLPNWSHGAMVTVSIEARGQIKEQGAKAIVKEMTPDELAAVVAASVDPNAYSGTRGPNAVSQVILANQFVAEQHNQWAKSAGGNASALAVQLAAAEMQGWSDDMIADRVFRETSREDVAEARDLASRVIEGVGDNGALLSGNFAIDRINEIAQAEGIGTAKTPYGRGTSHVKANVMVAAQSFIRSQLLGDAHKAVLAANQRVTQYELKKAGIDEGGTITLFRGIKTAGIAEHGTLTTLLGAPDSEMDRVRAIRGDQIRSQSAPLSSWSLSRIEAVDFAGGGASSYGALLRADVPVSSIVGLSSVGFGCIVEGEVIVNGNSFIVTSNDPTSPPKEFPSGEPFPVEKAILTINLDATEINQNWPKRTPDTYAALGLKSPVSKFNPYHDELGRFSSANAAATISGGALGANREVTISLAEAALGRSLTGPDRTLLREAPAGAIDFSSSPVSGVDRIGDPSRPVRADGTIQARVGVDRDDRGKLKQRGARTVANAMSLDEMEACEAAQRLQGNDIQHGVGIATPLLVTRFVAEQHNQWAETAGDHRPEALAVQVAAAEMQGWDDQKIADRVFRKTTRLEVEAAREIAKRVLADHDPEHMLHSGNSQTAINAVFRHLPREMNLTAAPPGAGPKANVIVAAQAFIRNELLGDAHKAVLAANQRVAQRDLKAAVGDAPTITLFRGVKVEPTWTRPKGEARINTFPTGGTIRSQSSPLSSWSVSRPEAQGFAGGFNAGVLLRADVPVSSIIGLSSVGFGCIVEGEAIVNGDSFTATVDWEKEATQTSGTIKVVVGKSVAAGGVKKAIPTINLDSTDINQDWPKRTPDTYAALGLPSPISKFNPYHDELGRFTTAGGDAYGGDTDRFTWAGSDLQDSPLQNKGAAVTEEAPGHYKVEYGDLDETITDDHEAGFAEEGSTHWGMWEGNYQMRNASAALMGLTPPKAKGGDDRHADPNMNEAYATGYVEGLTAIDQQNMARDIHTVNKVVQEISQAEETAPLLHRGMTDVDTDSHLLTAPIGSTYVTPLTAYSSDPAVALGFAADDQYADRPEVMVVVKPGSKAVHGGEDSFYDVDTYRTATGWVKNDYGPTEHVSQGRYRIVDRIETVGDVRGITRTGRHKEAIITTVIVEQVSTHGGSGSGWRDNKNEADALPPGMTEGLASDVRQLEMWKAQQEDVIPDWVWAMAGSLASGQVKKFNPHHDELGRFSSGPGGGVPAGPKRGQPHAASRKPSRLGMTGEPNPVTGKVMSNTEFGDTMETLFRQRAGRLSGFKQMFGTRLRALAGKGQQARTGPLDYRTSEYGLEVKSLNTRSKDKRVKIARRAAAAKQKKVERLGLKGGIVVQVVDFDRGAVTLYGWDKGFTNPSVKASPTSVNVQFNPMTQGAKVGEYRFTRSQWHKAQKETSRRDASGQVKGTWGDYDAPDTMGKSDDLAWRAELRKVREESGPLPRPDAVQRLMKDRGAPMTDEGEHIEPGDTVIELVEQEGDWVPHIYEAE